MGTYKQLYDNCTPPNPLSQLHKLQHRLRTTPSSIRVHTQVTLNLVTVYPRDRTHQGVLVDVSTDLPTSHFPPSHLNYLQYFVLGQRPQAGYSL